MPEQPATRSLHLVVSTLLVMFVSISVFGAAKRVDAHGKTKAARPVSKATPAPLKSVNKNDDRDDADIPPLGRHIDEKTYMRLRGELGWRGKDPALLQDRIQIGLVRGGAV